MASPKSRPTGFSRKAQMSVFTGYVAAGIGALIGVVLLIISFWQPTAVDPVRGAATDAVSPVGEAGAVSRSGGRNVWQSISAYYNAGRRNAELEDEVRIARVRLAEAEAMRQENRRLKAVLGLASDDVEPVAIARLIGSTASSTRRIAFLSAGRNQGIEVGMPVHAPKGLVGRVLSVGGRSARVLLLTDAESTVPVRRSKDDVVAFAEGRADGTLQIRLINLGINPLEEGDVLVTSGAGGLYRPGVAVARMSEITADGGIARLLANPAGTDFVSIEPMWRPEARQAVEAAAANEGVATTAGEE